MNFWKKNRVVILSIVMIFILLGSVLVWNDIVEKQKEKKTINDNAVDVSEVNNVSIVDEKLTGEDYRITQSYLFNYTKHKSATWYMGVAYIDNITINKEEANITLKENALSSLSIVATIEASKVQVNIGDIVYFVGTIDLATSEIHLSKISVDKIEYSSVTEISIEDLISNISLLKRTYFIVSGYMVTDGDKYKLYDSKNDYKNENESKKYFLIQWEEEFGYTGNQEITLRCMIDDTYVLGSCELKK